ncbi:MAG TPA: CapA family protein, partial [Gaiellaceae bacterium]|nr:CapA family protein [Gaiellaceae bacterium]
MPRRLVFALLPFAAAAATMGTLAFTTKSTQSRAAVVATPLTVTSKPTDWRAPGVAVTVGGFAGSGARVLLRADGRVVASTTAGKLGRYRLRFAPRRAGRLKLVVQSAGTFAPAGTLEVRAVSLDAVGDVTFGESVGPALAAHGGAYPWAFVGATLRSADITVGNLETAVSTRGVAAVKEFTFRGPPVALVPMRDVAGFDV